MFFSLAYVQSQSRCSSNTLSDVTREFLRVGLKGCRETFNSRLCRQAQQLVDIVRQGKVVSQSGEEKEESDRGEDEEELEQTPWCHEIGEDHRCFQPPFPNPRTWCRCFRG